MEATFQSYLAEAVYTMEREKRQRPESEATEVGLSAGLEDHSHPALSAMASKLACTLFKSLALVGLPVMTCTSVHVIKCP